MTAIPPPSGSPDPVDAYAEVAARFAAAIPHRDLRSPVASCPGWTVQRLVLHLGNVHAWAATVLETGAAAPTQDDEPASARAGALREWYLGKAGDLLAVLRRTPPEAECWNFVTGAGQAGFWLRRQLHETTMHLVDLDVAAGRTTALAPEVAVDGVDEVLTVLSRRMHRRGHPAALAGPVAVTADDTGDAWVVEPQPLDGSVEAPTAGPPVVRRLGVDGRTEVVAVADRVEAPAEVLYRLLWHRPVEPATLHLSGDPERVRAFLASRLTP